MEELIRTSIFAEEYGTSLIEIRSWVFLLNTFDFIMIVYHIMFPYTDKMFRLQFVYLFLNLAIMFLIYQSFQKNIKWVLYTTLLVFIRYLIPLNDWEGIEEEYGSKVQGIRHAQHLVYSLIGIMIPSSVSDSNLLNLAMSCLYGYMTFNSANREEITEIRIHEQDE